MSVIHDSFVVYGYATYCSDFLVSGYCKTTKAAPVKTELLQHSQKHSDLGQWGVWLMHLPEINSCDSFFFFYQWLRISSCLGCCLKAAERIWFLGRRTKHTQTHAHIGCLPLPAGWFSPSCETSSQNVLFTTDEHMTVDLGAWGRTKWGFCSRQTTTSG